MIDTKSYTKRTAGPRKRLGYKAILGWKKTSAEFESKLEIEQSEKQRMHKNSIIKLKHPEIKQKTW